MKVAYFAESPADEAALTILTEAILGRATTPVLHAGLRHRGWPAVKSAMRSVLMELHYHTDAEGFVFIVDSNGSPPHFPAHDKAPEPTCRLCQLRRIALEVQHQVRPRPHQPALKIALGVAVPAIEAWLLCGVKPSASEAAWINGQREGRKPFTSEDLKIELYGTARPSITDETVAMKNAATRLVNDLQPLETSFPQGFGVLRKDLATW